MSRTLDLSPLVEALREDERVVGIAQLATIEGRTRVVVVTTWDGFDAIVDLVPDLARSVLSVDHTVHRQDGARVTALAPDGTRLDLHVTRIGDLKPTGDGEHAIALLDPRKLIAQWIQWSRGRPRVAPDAVDVADDTARRVLRCDEALRAFQGVAPGSRLVGRDDTTTVRHALASALRARVTELPTHPACDALRSRVHAALRAAPHAAAGLRIAGDGARERFLAIADDEGFLGDRVLLDTAETHVRETTGREPRFEVGFALATFDQVEARYALGEAVGGCKPPLVPGILVGVAVTPTDELALWAAPTLREPTCDAACIADTGERTVVARTIDRDTLLSALTDAVDDALDSLPSLLRRARGAHLSRPDDPEALLRALHLPRSFVLAGATHGALTPGTTQLLTALALARAATDMEPVVARKLELAAGRLLLCADERDDDCSA